MQTNNKILALVTAAIMAAVTFTSCQQEEIPQTPKSEIKLNSDRIVRLGYEESEFKVSLTISGDQLDSIPAFTTDVDWLTLSEGVSEEGEIERKSEAPIDDIAENTSVDKSIIIKASVNKSELDRTGQISFSLEGADPVHIAVMQLANPDYKLNTNISYTLNISEIESNSVKVSVSPNIRDAYYYYGVVEQDFYKSFESKEAFVDEYIKAIVNSAQAYADKYNKELDLTPYLKKDFSETTINNLKALTNYVLVAFDMTLGGKSSKQASIKNFTTLKIPESSPEFDISIDEATATITVKPNGEIESYMMDVVAKSVWESYGSPKKNAEAFLNWIPSSGYSTSSFMHDGEYTACYYNPQATLGNLSTGDYVVFVFGTNGSKVTSGIAYKHFHFNEPK